MKRFTPTLALSFAVPALFLASLGGCKTGDVGVTNTFGTYAMEVNAAPEKATKSAEKALNQLKLLNVSVSLTKIDGRVTAKTAQNDDVSVNIEQAGSNVSRVSVRVGASGDGMISKQIFDKIKDDLR